MKTITSKKVLALYPGGGLLQDQYFKELRQKMWNEDPHKRKEETGETKKTIIETPGLGSNDRGSSGVGMTLGRDPNETKDQSLSSGYNQDLLRDGPIRDNDGEQTQTGLPPEQEESAYPNELFMDLDIKGQGHNESIRGHQSQSIGSHLKELLKGKPITRPHRRYSVN